MRALFADKVDAVARTSLEAAGWEVIEAPGLSGDALTERIAEVSPDALVVRSTKVRGEDVRACNALGLVVRAGAGVNTIDLAACADRGVYVANCPGKNAIAVAELVFGLIIALDRNLVPATTDTAAGRWRKSAHARGARGLYGRTLAVIGMGTIGEAVAWRARGFGMEVRAWSRSLDERRARQLRVTGCASAAEAVEGADVVSVHLAATPETEGLISEDLLRGMQPGTILINAARHEVMDEQAVLAAVRERGLRLGLDVLSCEPKTGEAVEHALLGEPGVLVTPHLGASTVQASEAVAAEVARLLIEWHDTGRVQAAVNLSERGGSDGVLVVRHLDRVGVLAGVFAQLRAASVNVQEMENTVLAGRRAAIARIAVEGAVSDEVLARINAVENVLSASYTGT